MPGPVPIAFCITDLDAGGAERALVQVVTRLNPAEWTPAVYCLGPRGVLADEFESREIRTVCLGARSSRPLSAINRLTAELRTQKPRLLQTFLFHANMTGRIAGWRAGVPIVVAGIRVAEREKRWHLWCERMTRRLVTHSTCVSQAVAEFGFAHGGLRRESTTVIENGVDAERFATAAPADLAEFGIRAGERTLLFVGRLHVQKGVMVLLEAIAPLLERNADLHLLIVGTGPLEKSMRERAKTFSSAGRIHFAGPRSDVPNLMRASTALVLASLWEGQPNVVLEALAAGLPVVATAVDGTAELVREGKTGWIAKPDSATSLREAIERCLNSDPEAVRSRSLALQGSIAERFTWDGCSRSYADLYRTLLQARDLM